VWSSTAEIRKKLQSADFYWQVGYTGLAAAGIIHGIFLVLFLYYGIYTLAAVNLLSIFIYWYTLYGLGIKTIESGDDRLIGWLVYLELVGHNLLASWYLGLDAGFQYYLYIPAFLPFFTSSYSKPVYLLRISIVLILALWMDCSSAFQTAKVPIPSSSLTLLHHINLFIFLAILSLLYFLYTTHEREYSIHLTDNSQKDPLTDLYNRRYFTDTIRSILRDSCQSGNCALVFADIDYFKTINDTYGHSCGDQIIVDIATRLRRHIGPDVIIARWGGDEFLLFFQHTHQEQLKAIMEYLRRTIAQSLFFCHHTNIHTSITLGGTMLLPEESFEEALQRADKALYQGKRAGRNRTVLL